MITYWKKNIEKVLKFFFYTYIFKKKNMVKVLLC